MLDFFLAECFLIVQRISGNQQRHKTNMKSTDIGVVYSPLTALIIFLILCVQRDETVTKRVKLPNEEEKEVPVTRSRRRVQDHHCDIIGDQFWEEHPDILEDDNC